MPYPRQRSSKMKKHVSRTPSGKRSIVYRKGSIAHKLCAICSAKLSAVPRTRSHFRKLTLTEKRPERRFAGILCGNCVSQLIKEKTRLELGSISREDIPLNHLKYLDTLKI